MNTTPLPRQAAFDRQRGASLLELLIGLTIGLLVAVAAVGTLMYSRVSSTTVGDSSRLYQDAATAFRVIGHHVRQGGSRRLVAAGTNVEFNGGYTGYGSNTLTVVVTGVNGTGSVTETLQISHDNDTTIQVTDCLGEASAAANNVTNMFTISNGELRCDGSGAGAAQPLVRGAEDFQVWYGVRNMATDTFQYFTADSVPTWDQIEAVMVCLRLAGEVSNNPTAAITGCNGEAVAADGRIRRVFRRVFNIRNIGI